jgi:hypothetical protein
MSRRVFRTPPGVSQGALALVVVPALEYLGNVIVPLVADARSVVAGRCYLEDERLPPAAGSLVDNVEDFPVFRISEPLGATAYAYDVASDGQRILALAPIQSAVTLTVLVNWQAELKK